MRTTLLLSLLALVFHSSASLLAIDYGAEWTKAALMKPGVPFDVLLTRDSKRKLQSVVGWKGDERLFGSEAAAVQTRFPTDSFQFLKPLLGTEYSQAAAANQSAVSLARTSESERGTFVFHRSDGTAWNVEELVGMQFGYVKELAEALGGEPVRDSVVTVPAYFSHFQRQAVLDSLEIAGLRPLALINDGTSVAVNFAMTRSFPIPETHIIYDAGAGSIRATLVTFSSSVSKSKKDKDKETTLIEVKGMGYDLVAGGMELDFRLRELLEEDFAHKTGVRIQGPRPVAKLAKEAARVKAILSANIDSSVHIESLYEDIDYRSKVTREQFEAACADLKPRFTQPVLDALAMARLTMDNVTSVILTGGASRTPMIQSVVNAVVGKGKIAQNVNADESSVLGAALYGASLSPLFRTKDIKVQDLVPYPIQMSYPAGQRTIHTPLFPRGSRAGLKKTVSLKRAEDFSVLFEYKDAPLHTREEILEVSFSGVEEAVRNLTDGGAKETVAKLTVQYSDSGLLSLREAALIGEGYEQSFAGALKGLFGAGKQEDVDQEADRPGAEGEQAPLEAPEMKQDPKELPLAFSEVARSVPGLTKERKRKSRQRLMALDAAEQTKRRREEERNQLESYIYKLRDVLLSDAETVFIVYSSEAERAALRSVLEEVTGWMHEAAETAELVLLREKRAALEAAEQPIQSRVKEAQEWPQHLSDLQRALTAGRIFLTGAFESRTSDDPENPPLHSDEELENVKTILEDTEHWLQEALVANKNRAKHIDATIKTWEMRSRGILLQDAVTKLTRRKAPKKPKKMSTTSESSSTTGAAEPGKTAGVEGQNDESQIPLHRQEL
ncbi:actin-like ATPase domain-containing protein [Dacryopinax primogenitus]|uniref:Actin-like ATPase domain-containing protein n=1 Tax=Dacryopinax primogenitus (strain DJM 731) TaxID=1858805 RepID=M5FSA4_DACPD|nr:actin-like ATPase domain-containing protein [Dacryopinax primogenitus]EJU00266.1 actin-like ATPase domain-containing protein [Dacryopinax primogenitus]